jgi:hypothetical protein
MAVTVEASSSFSGINVSAVDGLEVTRPSGFTAASLGLVIAGTDNGTVIDPAFVLSPDTGWTEVARTKSGTSDRQSMIWRQSNPPDATTDVVPAVSDDVGAFYLRVEGVDTSTPVDAVGTQQYGTTSGGVNFTVTDTVTTVTDGALAVVVVVFDGCDGGIPITFGSAGVGANGWGSLTNVQSDASGLGVTVAYATKLVTTAGDAGSVEFDPPANDGWAAIMFAIRPAAGGGGTDYDRGHADTLDAGDAVGRSADATRSAADTSATADIATRGTASERSTSEAVGATDTAERSTEASRAHADTLGMLDEITATVTPSRDAADALGILDTSARTSDSERTAGDTLDATDVLARATEAARAHADTLGIVDAVAHQLTTGGGTDHERTVADTLAATDTTGRQATTDRSPTDTSSTLDAIARAVEQLRTPGDLLGLADAAAGVVPGAEAWSWLIYNAGALQPATARLGPSLDPTTTEVGA